MKLYNEDCIVTMRAMPEKYLGMVLTSPPYDDIRSYNGHFEFAFHDIVKELYRVTKVGGCVIWVVADATIDGSETGTSFKQALYFIEVGFKLNDTMIYYKNNPLPRSGPRYNQHFEYMFCFSKDSPATFNPIMEETKYKGIANYRNRGTNNDGQYEQRIRKDTKKIGNVFSYLVGGGHSSKDKVAYKHPAIMPEELASDMIKTWSNEGDIVYDPFGGSGTTGIVAKELNRNFILSEISDEYCLITKERFKTRLNIDLEIEKK